MSHSFSFELKKLSSCVSNFYRFGGAFLGFMAGTCSSVASRSSTACEHLYNPESAWKACVSPYRVASCLGVCISRDLLTHEPNVPKTPITRSLITWSWIADDLSGYVVAKKRAAKRCEANSIAFAQRLPAIHTCQRFFSTTASLVLPHLFSSSLY